MSTNKNRPHPLAFGSCGDKNKIVRQQELATTPVNIFSRTNGRVRALITIKRSRNKRRDTIIFQGRIADGSFILTVNLYDPLENGLMLAYPWNISTNLLGLCTLHPRNLIVNSCRKADYIFRLENEGILYPHDFLVMYL